MSNLVNTAINLPVPKKGWEFIDHLINYQLLKRAHTHGVIETE
jgi:hypothetical protein